jgi:hypothetical protein
MVTRELIVYYAWAAVLFDGRGAERRTALENNVGTRGLLKNTANWAFVCFICCKWTDASSVYKSSIQMARARWRGSA